MSRVDGSIGAVLGRGAVAICLVLLASVPARAQQPSSSPPSAPEFMSRYRFQMSAAALAVDDDRFSWDTHWGGDFDLLDYVTGRMSFLADYQAVLGDQFQPFDPNQGTYTLAASASVRAGRTEFAGVFRHVSRHLGDRAKNFGIAYNVLAGRVMRQLVLPRGTLDIRADAGKALQRAYVDYTWTGAVDATIRQALSSRVGVFGHVFGETYGVVPRIARRGLQQGGRVEGGVRVSGRGGALELFAGYERVVDADPLDRQPRRWAFAGFRLTSN